MKKDSFDLLGEDDSSAEDDKIHSRDDLRKQLEELGLDAGRFIESALVKLENAYNKKNVSQFVNIIMKHGINKDCIYENVGVLLNVTPPNLDKILTLLEETGASTNAIEYVFHLLDRVNVNKLPLLGT